ncbi:MAG: GAK system CofD-like protein [Desulfovibrionales bacterium]
MATARITREVGLPDPIKLERYRRSPDLGPKILFFSGGTALRRTARELTRYTHNSIHVVTPFDSGGSSAKLRKTFRMPAVGDVRSRLMALSDQSILGNPEIFALFAHRMSQNALIQDLQGELERMSRGRHPLVASIPDPMRKIIRNHFRDFIERMGDFDLRGASIGNIVLTAGYLTNRRHLDPVIFLFSKLVQVLGVVRPVVNANLHLAAELESGEVVIGQHRMTGKEAAPLASRIDRIWLTRSLDDPASTEASIRAKMRERILGADLICYPMGSFFTSVIANLLPKGVGKAIAGNRCPKVFIPNTKPDPELFGYGLADQVEILLRTLLADSKVSNPRNVLDFVLVDTTNGPGLERRELSQIQELGFEVLDLPLISAQSSPLIDEKLLVPILLSLA